MRADQKRRAKAEDAKGSCEFCARRVGVAKAKTCGSDECHAALKRQQMRRAYELDPGAKRQKVAAYRASWTPEQVERERLRRLAWIEAGGRDLRRSADSRRRARKLGTTVEKFTHREIFERDGWRCGICGRRINRKLAAPQGGSASLDHVIPLSLGGAHTRANVRASHLDCNVARGVDYGAYLESRYSAAEAATRGNLVSTQGRRQGISANQFFTGKPRSLKFASPELKDWFRANGANLTAARFRSQATSSAPRASSRVAGRSSGS